MRTPLLFFAAGLPKAQPRAKARAMGKFAQVYNPKTADDWKMIVRNEAAKAWDAVPWEGPLCVNLTFYFPRIGSHFKGQSAAAKAANAPRIVKDNAPRWHTTKPDRDNCDKAVMDALTNLGVWHDDKQVCDGRIRKFYADRTPGCLIEIKEAVYE